MKYEAEIDGRRMGLELDEEGGHIRATIDHRSYDVEVVQPEDGVYLFFVNDLVYEARVSRSGPDSLSVKIGDRILDAKVIDRRHRRAASELAGEGRQYLSSPMPGKVVRVLLVAGDAVAAGQGVVVVEAMKMQNEVRSSKAGRLIEVRVAEGATVNANQVLAIVE